MYFSVPVILLKRLVILPNQEIKIELNNLISKETIKEAINKYKGEILVVAPIDELEEEPGVADLPKVGVIAKIKNRLDNDSSIQVKLRGIKRVAVNRYYNEEESDILYSEVMYIDLPSLVKEEENAISKKLINVLKEYIKISSEASNDILNFVLTSKDLGKTTDAITSYLPFEISKKLEYMQEINPLNRAKSLIRDMNEEIKAIMLDEELDAKVEDGLQNEQREYILKEKLKVIKKELGEDSWKSNEINKYLNKINTSNISASVKNHIISEINKYELMNEASPEVSVMHNYLDWIINLPWNKSSNETKDAKEVYKKLDNSHYGLEEIKSRICEYVAIKKINKKINSPIICLVGPPGVGKTSIAMSIADALNRKFYKISVGGLNDSTELVGTRRTYLASAPGKIIQGIKKCGTNNPIILIDEVDKMVKDYKGDPASTLLEILDPVQNKNFIDNYIEEPFDLSNVMFILTANYIENIPSTIIDRVELIELNSYTLFEKKDIAKKYILPRVKKEYLLDEAHLKISDELLYFIINNYTKEAGVRDLERVISSLMRKVAINNLKSLNEEKIVKLLGTPKFSDELIFEDLIGVANMLAYTPLGGLVTKTEVITLPGDGKIKITGNVGDVMAESVEVSLSMLKNKYKFDLSKLDFHIHFLDAATKKDGPSAGLAIATAITSVIKKKKISEDIAFTGEVSLNGTILKIGGIKEKLIGAYNKNIKVVYMPKSNIEDLKDIPKIILDNIKIIPISDFNDLYTNLFK